ncbi:MAG TPA: hypothetical protein VH088_21640 [Terriglobales bacterium]|nr:hypothetical protein [Terriglobales bacterium]
MKTLLVLLGVMTFYCALMGQSVSQTQIGGVNPNGKRVIWGAGIPNEVLDRDAAWPFDSWMLIRKSSEHLSIYPSIRVDGIALIIADEGGGLLYWSGRHLDWKQEE